MKVINPLHPKLDYKDVLIVPKTSYIDSRKLVNLKTTYKFRNSRQEWTGVPIMSSNMDTVTGINSLNILSKRNWLSCMPKHMNKDFSNMAIPLPLALNNSDMYALSCGINKNDIDILEIVIKRLNDIGHPLKFLCVDVANGHLAKLTMTCASIRDRHPYLTIIAGNVVTPLAVEDLIVDGGVDIVKVGIGSGLMCITRQQTGVGYPQLSAILECSFTAASLKGYTMTDGGITCPGDVCKAYCAGADFVMLGSMLSGHDENPGEVVNGHKTCYGMSSTIANNMYGFGLGDYKASEGRIVSIPLKGSIEKTMNEFEGGIRSCCTYINAQNIKEMYYNSKFILVNRQLEQTLEKNTIGK